MQSTQDRTDTELVQAVAAGDSEAFGTLFDRWFNSAWNVARTVVRDDDLAADVAQDALLTAWQRLGQLDNPDAFGGWLLRITRNRALNRLQREQRSRSTGNDVVSDMRDAGAADAFGTEPVLGPDVVNEVRDRQELVWAAAEALGEREVSLLDLHLRHGLSAAEIAEELGVEANNAHQQLYRLRTRLGEAIGSYMLWRKGNPLCESLAAAVSGQKAFDKSVARAVKRHQAMCDVCSEERAALVDPGKLFAGVPLLGVPMHLKTNAAAALESAGVPMGQAAGAAGGSSGSTGSTTDGSGSPTSPHEVVEPNGSASGDPSAPTGSSGPSNPGGAASSPSGPVVQAAGITTGPILDEAVVGHHVPTIVETGVLDQNRNLLLAVTGAASAVVVAALTLLLLNAGSADNESAQAIVVGADQVEPLIDQNPEPPAGPVASSQNTATAQGSLEQADATSSEDATSSDNATTGGDATTGDDATTGGDATSSDNAATGGDATSSDNATTGGDATSSDNATTGGDATSPTDVPTTAPTDPEVTEVLPTTTVPPESADPKPDQDQTSTSPPDATPSPDTTPKPGTTATPDPDPPNPDPDPPTPDPPTPDPPDPDPPPRDPPPDRTTTTTGQRPPNPPDPPDPDPPRPTPDEPKIVQFTSRRPVSVTVKCVGRTGTPYEALWATENADTATLTINGRSNRVKPSGSFVFCGTRGQVIKLTATGPGGTDEDATTL